MKGFFLCMWLLLAIGLARAAFDYPGNNAENAALNNSNLAARALPDGAWLNPALTLAIDHGYATLSYARLFDMPELSYASGLAGWRKGRQAVALGLSSFGSSVYRETQLRLLAARSLLDHRLWLGAALNGYFIHATGYSLNPAWGLDIGFTYQVNHQWTLASTLENINQPEINGYSEEVPQRLRFGLAYQPMNRAVAYLAVEKDRFYDPLVLLGLGYQLSRWLQLASGFSSSSDFPSAGFRLQVRGLRIQYGIQTHFDLGVTHFFQISYGH